MPWELLIHGRGGGSLGSCDAVAARISAACGGVTLSAPPLPPAEALAAMSEITRAAFLTPILRSVYEEGDLSFELWCPDEPDVTTLHVDVRGQGDPLPLLRRLCGPDGWVVYDAESYFNAVTTGGSLTGSMVDLAAACAPQWDLFCCWRDRAIDEELDPPE